MSKILTSLFCLLSCIAFAEEYTLSLLGVESMTEAQCSVTAINDKGQVLGRYEECHPNNKSKIYIYDNKNGLILIDSKDQWIYPITMNNAGQVLGSGGNDKPFVWSKVLGIRWLDIFNSTSVKANDLNDLGQIIGSYSPVGSNTRKPFLWDYGVVTDMGPGSEFGQKIEALGYHVMEIQLMSINNKGEIAGYFAYGKFNEKKKKYVQVAKEAFFWDGDMHILQLPQNRNLVYRDEEASIKVNNLGTVMIPSDCSTYLWDLREGLRVIDNFIGLAFNDSNILLGRTKTMHEGVCFWTPSIWKDGAIIELTELLGVSDINQMSPLYSDNYGIENLSNFSDINNKGQIPCVGSIWGDSYPCLIEPAKKNEVNLSAYFNPSSQGDSLLHEASKQADVEILQDLINLGINCNERNLLGQTPLYLVAEFSRNVQNDLEKKST